MEKVQLLERLTLTSALFYCSDFEKGGMSNGNTHTFSPWNGGVEVVNLSF